MAKTYEPIATTTLVSNQSTITFSSIPSTYTDLRLVLSAAGLSSADLISFRIGGNTSTIYSITRLRGDGTTATTSRMSGTGVTFWQPVNALITASIPFMITLDIFNYSNTSTYKTGLINYSADENGNGNIAQVVGLLRSTNAINNIEIRTNNGYSYTTGTTATLYGIKAA